MEEEEEEETFVGTGGNDPPRFEEVSELVSKILLLNLRIGELVRECVRKK